jgi:hypothetical protein
MPLGSVSYERESNANGERLIWLAPNVVDRLKALRGPGESSTSSCDWRAAASRVRIKSARDRDGVHDRNAQIPDIPHAW